jgi:hypothetical protein
MTIDAQDILLSKAVDGTATTEEWSQLETMASLDASLWERLAAMTRLQSQLASALDQATDAAERVELDLDRAHNHRHLSIHVRTWGGWAVAAVLALGLFGGNLAGLSIQSNGGQVAGIGVSNMTPDEVLDQYRTVGTLDGRFVSELPTVMVDVRVDPQTGQQEMFYLRRFLERVPLDGLYTSDPQNEGVIPVVLPASSSSTSSDRVF